MTREYTCAPNDYAHCPKCDACGGPAGAIRVRGVMTDKQYNDRRCNSCGHLWTIGDTLELPLGEPEKPVAPAKGKGGPPDYDFGDGFVRETEDVPF